ncbi:RnfH family protein [Pollutimonas sp. M17]|uniref:RnfH family protein n=1 Tax=Pollutimonas sp. M17 TaxID=2962065 RepID=UPI0021F43ED9|nr:RnfH family protein [Pollutimonas sp. M17]UYO95376.1 RnfH family protein [Pollutimonas sp. M17]
METEAIGVQVVYAEPGSAWQADLRLPARSTVEQALRASRFARLFPNYPYDSLKVGVYGQECALDRVLADGDRIEIYRPLVFDPMESRRRRALHRKAFMTKPKNRPRRRKARLAAALSGDE